MNVAGRCITGAVRWTHDATLATVRALDQGELAASPGPTAPPISFHVWHMARWADRLAAQLGRHVGEPGAAGVEVWTGDGWDARFGFSGHDLGMGDTGMGMADDGWGSLPEPARDVLLEYAEAAFRAANQVIKIAGAQADAPCTDLYGRPGTVADVLVAHLGHVSRHLGMIEALIGLTGRAGSASI